MKFISFGCAGNPCSYFNHSNPQAYTISATVVGSMVDTIDPAVLPPPLPPAKPLSIAEIVDPPLPPVSKLGSSNASAPAAADEAHPSSSDDKIKSSAIKSVGDSGITAILVTLFFCLFSFF